MERTRYSKNDVKVLYKINKSTKIVRDTATGNIKSLKITEVVEKARYLDRKGEKVDHRYGTMGNRNVYIYIYIYIYIYTYSLKGGPEEVKKKLRNVCKNGSGRENEI